MLEFEDGTTLFDIQDLMEDSGLSRNGLMSFLRRGKHEPIFQEGRKGYYDSYVLEALRKRRGYVKPTNLRPSKTSGASKIPKEYEERIAHFEKEIKTLQSQMLKIVYKIKDIEKVVENPVFS